jgi:hypothetical protein
MKSKLLLTIIVLLGFVSTTAAESAAKKSSTKAPAGEKYNQAVDSLETEILSRRSKIQAGKDIEANVLKSYQAAAKLIKIDHSDYPGELLLPLWLNFRAESEKALGTLKEAERNELLNRIEIYHQVLKKGNG